MGRSVGSSMRAVTELVLLFPPREPFKSRDLTRVVSIMVGYDVSSGTVGQCLSHLRQRGIVERVPVCRDSDDWIVKETIV